MFDQTPTHAEMVRKWQIEFADRVCLAGLLIALEGAKALDALRKNPPRVHDIGRSGK